MIILLFIPRRYNLIMPKSKYVLKEDVEKGLVDPTKTLEDQPEYKQKI